jgi:hypothetical protein
MEACLEFESALRASGTQLRVGLGAFGDAAIGEELQRRSLTDAPEALHNRLADLDQYDGGDAEEDADRALKAAVEMLDRGGFPEATRAVLLFTDAPPREARAFEELAPRLKELGMRAYVFGPYYPYVEPYLRVASHTGGQYLNVHKDLTSGMHGLVSKLTA